MQTSLKHSVELLADPEAAAVEELAALLGLVKVTYFLRVAKIS